MQLSSQCFFAAQLSNQVSLFRCAVAAYSRRSFTCLCFVSAMKKRRLGECFFPGAITNRVAKRKSEQDKLDSVFKTMNSVDILGLREKNLVISEVHALLLLSSRLTFLGVVTIQSRFDTLLSQFVTKMKSIRYNPSRFDTNSCVCIELKQKPQIQNQRFHNRIIYPQRDERCV